MTALLAVYTASLVGSRWGAKSHPQQLYLALLALPLLLSLTLGIAPRFIGLLLGLALIRLIVRLGRGRPAPLQEGFGLLGLALAGVIAFQFGFRIEQITNPWGGVFALGALSLPLTVLWTITMGRALGLLSLLDRSGRLLTQVLLVALSALLVVELLQRTQVGPAPLALGLSLLGFLLGSWRRPQALSSLSNELGFCLALLSIGGLIKVSTSLALLSPLLALGLPLLSSQLAIVAPAGWHWPTAQLLRSRLAWRGHRWHLSALLLYFGSSSLALLLAALAHPTHPYLLGAGLLLILMTSLLAIQPGLLCRPALRFSGARRIELFGVPLDRVGLEQAAARLLGWIREGRGPHLVATPDTPTLMRAGRNLALQNAYRQASLVTADGTGILWAARLLGARLPQRVTGIDLIETVCRQASVAFNRGDFRRCRLFLLGARPGVAAEAAARLGKRYPGVQIVGTCHGYFRAAETEALLQEIRGTAPDILLVGLGVPRQELWMVAHRDQLSTPVLIGVGGSFDVLSGRLCRAPRSWQKLGLEWLYRLIAQPRRLLRLWPLPLFLGRLLLGLLRMLL